MLEEELQVERELMYSDEERKHRKALIKRLCQMRDDREAPHPELDDMSYTQYYDSNRKKDLSYIPPKKNKQDVRIVTGTTREKDTTLLSTLLNMDLKPDVAAFDQDDLLISELGDNIADLVEKSRQIEDWEKKRPIIYRELISQGDVFVEELWVDEYRKIPLGDLNWDPVKDGASKMSFTERLQKIDSKAMSRMISGRKVYLGDLSVEYAQDQDIIAVVNIYPRVRAEGMYGQWERWKYVPKSIDNTILPIETGDTYFDWNMVSNNDDQVVDVRIYDMRANRFMIMLNGVMMLPINYPMSAISPTGAHVIAQGKLEPISGFAYSKSQPAKTKVDQEVLDEVTKLMIEKTRQSFKPPMGNTTKKVFSNNIFLAGTMTNDIKERQLFPLLDAQGVNAAEFNFYNTIRESINEKTTNDVYGGNDPAGDPTATEIIEQKQQQMLKLGSSVDGVVNLERTMTWNRIQTIIKNWTVAEDKNAEGVQEGVMKSISVKATLSDGQSGMKMFRMTNDEFPNVRDQEQEEEEMSEKYNSPMRVIYLNPMRLRNLKAKWFITINPTQKSNDKLSQLLFVQNIQTAQQIFGPESLNYDYLKQRYATLINEDYTKMFQKMDFQQMVNQDMSQDAGNQATGGTMKPVTPNQAAGKQPLKAAM